MRREDVPEDILVLAFDFFFCFSRFEFALKENKYLKNEKAGARAEPGWKRFVETWQSQYKSSAAARKLLELGPKQQTVEEDQNLTWRALYFLDDATELQKTVLLLKTVRNNLFHGGKHSVEGWDDLDRTRELLSAARTVLADLASLTNLCPDYTRYY